MQCPSCRAVYSNGLSLCPRCKAPAAKPSPDIQTEPVVSALESPAAATSAVSTETTNNASSPAPAPKSSSLIEFPGTSRASRPQWRKELSARVREIQERRAREAEEMPPRRLEQPPAALETAAPQLGLVPTPDAPEINPIVAAALKRLERARQPPPARSRQRTSLGGGMAATATARVAEEQYETDSEPLSHQASAAPPVSVASQPIKAEVPQQPKAPEPQREHQLAVVPAQPAQKIALPVSKPEPKRVAVAAAQEAMPVNPKTSEATPAEEFYDDRAPLSSRIAGSLIDLLVVAFASSAFAAIIELTNGNWADWRVLASMGGIVLILMFLYLTAATALAGRTWGMSLVSLRAVDADTGLPPTTKQAIARAILYIVSLITLGLGILYALFDAEGRTVHDHLSGTAVVRE